MTKRNKDLLFDKRIVQRNIEAGKVTKDELSARIDGLPDLQDKCDDIVDILFGDKKLEEEQTLEVQESENGE